MDEEIKKSSDNLYADFGYKNAEKMQAKAVLARTIYRIIKQRKLSQPKASELLGIPQSSLSKLLRGEIAGFSTDRLLKILNQLGQDVDIKIKPVKASKKKRRIGRIHVSSIETSYRQEPLAAKGRD